MVLSAARAQAEGYTYQIGGTYYFFLIGGKYELYVDAHVTPAEASTGHPHPCYFSGDLTSMAAPQSPTEFGGPVGIALLPYRVDSHVTLARGIYRLHVLPLSMCRWRVTIVSDPGNAPGMTQLLMLRNTESAKSAALGQTVQFYAQVRLGDTGDPQANGTLEVLHGGKLVRTEPLLFGLDNLTREPAAYVNITWSDANRALLGDNVARFTVHSRGQTFTSTVPFTLDKAP